MPDRQIEHRDSQTAGFTCMARAFAAREADPRFRGPDTLAQVFLPNWVRVVFQVGPLRRFVVRRFYAPGMYEYVLARTRLIDQVFQQALRDCFPQIVLLGAGFDTRALRFAAQNHSARIFELDAAPTQQPKLAIYHRKGIALPPALSFVPVNFDHQSIAEALTGSGFRPGLLTLFVMEGVTMYLTAGGVDQTLRAIRRLSGPGSRLVFDHVYGSVLRRENRYYGEREVYEGVARAGEAWSFGIEEGQVEAFLSERGYQTLAVYPPAELQRQFLTAADGTTFGQINGTHCLVVAGPEPM